VDEACLTLPIAGRSLDAEGIAADPELAEAIRGAISALCLRVSSLHGSG
jgi:hypothetical protein